MMGLATKNAVIYVLYMHDAKIHISALIITV